MFIELHLRVKYIKISHFHHTIWKIKSQRIFEVFLFSRTERGRFCCLFEVGFVCLLFCLNQSICPFPVDKTYLTYQHYSAKTVPFRKVKTMNALLYVVRLTSVRSPIRSFSSEFLSFFWFHFIHSFHCCQNFGNGFVAKLAFYCKLFFYTPVAVPISLQLLQNRQQVSVP